MGLLTQAEYKDYYTRFKIVWNYLKSCSYSADEVVENICEIRGYSLESNMPKMLKEVGFLYLKPELFNQDKIQGLDKGDLGLYSKDGNFLLLNRFIFPVKDMLGNIIALIGWFPDEKKYITTPSKLFSKKCLFFGLEQLKNTGVGKDYFLVEGIFDSLSIRSLGFNCIAAMGITTTQYTQSLYSLFRRLVAIPDNDSEGRNVVLKDEWKIPNNGKYLRWRGKFKDIDDILKYYDMFDIFKEVWNEPERVVVIDC